MGALNIPFPKIPKAVRPEIPSPHILNANMTKGEIEARMVPSLYLSNLVDTLSTTEFKRVISLMKDNDTISRAWKAVLCVLMRERNERNAKARDEKEEKDRKYAEEIARLE
ncbi:hypothetical protein AgCh_012672 [Apium graveolens]